MKCFKKSSIKETLVSILLITTYLPSDARIVRKDEYACDSEGTWDPCLDCEIKQMSASEVMLSDATKKFFDVEHHLKSTKHKDKLHVFHCKCVQLSVRDFITKLHPVFLYLIA